MGLTGQSTWLGVLKNKSCNLKRDSTSVVVALAGNPNTGKSTVFNSITGLNQHTGNWPGKTVSSAQGTYEYKGESFLLVDLPGAYSLLSNSAEEEVARDFICFGKAKCCVVVADATCLERNLNLVLQVLEITDRVVVCVNLMDEARRKKIEIDLKGLSEVLGVPVVGTNARDGEGLDDLKDMILKVCSGDIKTSPRKIEYDGSIENAVKLLEQSIPISAKQAIRSRWLALRLIEGDSKILDAVSYYCDMTTFQKYELKKKLEELDAILKTKFASSDEIKDAIVSNIVLKAEEISRKVVSIQDEGYKKLDRQIDDILTSKLFGIPIMLVLLGFVFWLTISGANYPSALLAKGLFYVEDLLTEMCFSFGIPDWLHGAFVLGIYRTVAWVVSVMLPPMAIFFPLFTVLEDLGYLPRVAFNLDNFFKKAHAHGKQALTMCMGFGCNAAGVIACRIIDSPRERLIATITNNFVPCNGRFPTLIALSTIFVAGSFNAFQTLIATLTMLTAIVSASICNPYSIKNIILHRAKRPAIHFYIGTAPLQEAPDRTDFGEITFRQNHICPGQGSGGGRTGRPCNMADGKYECKWNEHPGTERKNLGTLWATAGYGWVHPSGIHPWPSRQRNCNTNYRHELHRLRLSAGAGLHRVIEAALTCQWLDPAYSSLHHDIFPKSLSLRNDIADNL